MASWDLMLCFYFTFLDPVQTSALMRSSETKLQRWICTLTPCSFASSGYISKKIHFICKTCMLHWPWLWVLPFALPSPLKSEDDGQGLEPVVRGWGLRENQTRTSLHRPQVENRLSKSEAHPPYKKHCGDFVRELTLASHRLAAKSRRLTLMWIIVPLCVG